jgi:adenylate cyclase
VIGKETATRLGDPALTEVDLVAVKGKSQAGRVYTLLPQAADQGADFGPLHRQLLCAYRRQHWRAAEHLLDDRRLAGVPHLAPVYDLYRRRIAHFRNEPPPSDWDDVFTAVEK